MSDIDRLVAVLERIATALEALSAHQGHDMADMEAMMVRSAQEIANAQMRARVAAQAATRSPDAKA